MNFRIAVAAAALLWMPATAFAQETAATTASQGALAFQLNKAETREGSCQLTFVIQNNTGSVIEKSIYNIAIVDTDGAISQLVNIELRPLPVGKPKVQGFGIAGATCESISAISINEVSECILEDGSKSDLCETASTQSSREGISIEFPWVL